jgi:hypothetical protein
MESINEIMLRDAKSTAILFSGLLTSSPDLVIVGFAKGPTSPQVGPFVFSF